MLILVRAVILGIVLFGPPTRSVCAREIFTSRLTGDSTVVFGQRTVERPSGMKSGTTACALSIVGTAVPAVLAGLEVWEGNSDSELFGAILVGALIIGPSLGHFYAERPGRACSGIGIRILAGAGVAAALLAESGEVSNNGLKALGVLGALAGGASIAADIIAAPHSADVHNEEARQAQMTIGLMPTPDAVGLRFRADIVF